MELNVTAFLLGLPPNYDALEPADRTPYLEDFPGFINATGDQQDYVSMQNESWFRQDWSISTNDSQVFWSLVSFE